MKAHTHVEMITAKANNMDLIAIRKIDEVGWREVLDQSEIKFKSSYEYFLCLPQHKEACLHWLNGGECGTLFGKQIAGIISKDKFGNWFKESIWCKDTEIRIKPKKEKRWIVYRQDGEILGPFDSYEFAEGINSGQVIEIEVKV